MRMPALPLILLPLAACSSLFGGEPQVVNPAPPGVSYRVINQDAAAADRRAQDYCGRYGKTAKTQKTDAASDGTIVEYSCS
jgi:hypothetical protein